MRRFSREYINRLPARLAWRYFRSLRGRQFALTLGLSLTLLWILVFLSTTVLRNRFSEILFDQQYAATRRLAADLDNKLRDRINLLSIAATMLPAELDGDILANHLQQFGTLSRMFSGGVVVVGLDGKAIADFPAVPGRRGTYFGDRGYFRKVIDTRQPFIDRPVMGKTMKRPLLGIAVPVFSDAGTLRALLVGAIDLTAPDFLGLVFDQDMSGKAQFFVVSPHENVFVASSDPARVLSTTPPRGSNLMFDRFVDGFEGSGIAASSSGVERLYSGKRVPTANWLVVAALPAEVAFRPVVVMRNYLIAIAGILTVMAIFFAHWATRRMFVPLDEAKRAMRRMTRGETPLVPLPVTRVDEIGGLIDNFNVLVTDRHRSEVALAVSEQRFLTLAENAPDAIFVEAGGKFVYLNAAALRLFGAQSANELIGQTVISRVPRHLHGVVDARLRLLNEGKQNVTAIEQKLLRLDGTIVYAEVSAFPYPHNQESGALVFARDTTERRHVREALRKSEERFQRLAALSSEWYWEQDQHFRFTRITGWSIRKASKIPEQFLGHTRWELAVDLHAPSWKAHIAMLEAHLPFSDFEYLVKSTDGSLVWYSINGEPLFDEKGVFIGYRGTGKNISERKQAEEALRLSRERVRELAAHQEHIKELERTRIARDIHDELGQTLAALRIDASMLLNQASGVDPRFQDDARMMLDHIDRATER